MTSASAGFDGLGAGHPVRRDDGRRYRGQEQRLIADLFSAVAFADPHEALGRAAIAAGEEGGPSCPSPSEACATAIAVGVLPPPPAVKLPMQITGKRER